MDVEQFLALGHKDARDEYLKLVKNGPDPHAEKLRAAYWETHKISVMVPPDGVAPGKLAGAPAEAVSVASDGGGFMGMVLFWIGLAVALGSFLIDPGVSTNYGGGGLGGISLPERVVNMQMLNFQHMVTTLGCGLMISGAVFATRRR